MDRLYKIAVVTLGILLTPLVLIGPIIIGVYRILVHILLKFHQPDYRGQLGLMEYSFDGSNRVNASVINILIYAKPIGANKAQDIGDGFVRIMKSAMKVPTFKRGKYKIERWLGIRCWREIDICFEKQVRFFDADNFETVRDYLSDSANLPIYDDRLWEILVCTTPIDGLYPVIIRIHHAMGDGYAIRKLFVDAQHEFKRFDVETLSSQSKISKSAIESKLASLYELLLTCVFASTLIALQFLRPVDRNSFRADVMSGRKHLRWGATDFDKIKRIKNWRNCTITEIILEALSKSLDDIFKSRGETVTDITVTFPVRKSQKTRSLKNNFHVIGLKLPINTNNRRTALEAAIARLMEQPLYQSNFYLPRIVLILFLWLYPKWVYKCTEATVIMSNMPGASEKFVYDEFEVESLVFFLQNLHDNNGLGVMGASYVDKFTFSVILDRKLVKDENDAQQIVDGMTEYIDHMYQSLKTDN